MPIPLWLMEAVEEKISQYPPTRLATAYNTLNKSYKEGESTSIARNKDELFWDAYLAARFPATYGAVEKAIKQIPEDILGNIQTVLDLGTGPGTAVFALAEALSKSPVFTCTDKDPSTKEIFQYLWDKSPYENSTFSWLSCDIEKGLSLASSQYDAVVCSYTFIESDNIENTIEEIWKRTRSLFLVVEPGTMQGFSIIKKIRSILCQKGAFLAAPCPHEKNCPMEEPGWCHFSARIPRSSLMRKIKAGELGYEDEKFSYCAFVREKASPSSPRILRHPQVHGGHINFQLCTDEGIQDCLISRKNPLYKKARKSSWGDSL